MKVTFDKSVGARLHQFVLILKISQTAFAQSISISRGHLSDVLHGRKGIGGDTLVNVAKAYRQLNVRWLLTGEGAMYEYPSYYPPPELESGIPDKLEEGVRIEYARPEGTATTQARLDDHERRLRILEGRK